MATKAELQHTRKRTGRRSEALPERGRRARRVFQILANEPKETWNFASKSRPDKQYAVKRHQDDHLSCNCPAWCFKKQPDGRHCVHINLVVDAIRCGDEGYRHLKYAQSVVDGEAAYFAVDRD